jgi:O-antigen/teichoic acid export membrane protein
MRAVKLATYFLPFIANSLLRLITIPATTYILGPPEYGLFALMMGVVSICTVLASSATSYVINHHVHPGDLAPGKLIMTLLGIEAGFGFILALICFLSWADFARWMGVSGDVSPLAFLALLLSVPLGAFWTSGNMVMVFDGRARLYSATLIAQGIVQLLASVFALYILNWRVGALVSGQIAGIATCAVGGYFGLKRHFSIGFDRKIAREALVLMPWSTVSGFANSGTDLLERVVLGRVTGAAQLGLYVHAQSYRGMFGTAGKAFVQVLQPAMMREARAGQTDFPDTREGWNLVYVMFSMMGITFALVGREIIGLLTHGKFVGAAVFVPFWCVYLTFQYLGRAQVAMMYVHGQGKRISSALLASNIVSGALMLVLGIPFHGFGLVAAVLAGEAVNRALLQFWTYRLWSLPFQDGFALLGSASVIVTAITVDSLAVPLVLRAFVLLLICAVVAVTMAPSARRFLMKA